MKTRELTPFEATHPGGLLKQELKARGISQKEFAQGIDMQPTMLNEIIKEKRAITAEIALILEKALEIPADYWMRFQSQYDLDTIRVKEKHILKTRQIEIWNLMKQLVPVSIFGKLNVLTNSLADNISLMLEIYGVTSIDNLVTLISVEKHTEYYRKSDKLKSNPINIFAWSRYAQWKAKSEKANTFNPDKKEELVKKLKQVFYRNRNIVEQTKRILNEYGILFLVIEKFNQSPIDGYSFWCNENPAIVITLRMKTLDNFAFNVMHELGHIFKHLLPDHSQAFLDVEYAGSDTNEKEKEAHRFAQQYLIDDTVWLDFIKENPHYIYNITEFRINQLAEKIEVSPAIILGRYCFETNNYSVKTGIDRTLN